MTTPRPGRRRQPARLSLLLPFLFLLFASTASAASAVLGIDLGTNFIKTAIVKPGTPLDIVLTKDSKRKEASVIAFKPSFNGPVELGSFPERLYGSDAIALGGRFPGDVYINLKSLLGASTGASESSLSTFKERSPALRASRSEEMGTVVFQSGAFSDKEQAWSVEELLAMELQNIRRNAETMSGKGSRIVDAVITVPAFYTAEERRAVETAASLAGLNVMALVSDGLAVGVDYAVKRDFPNVSKGGQPEVHLVFDMGAGSTTATVLRFQSRDVKDVGRFNKTVQEVTVLGTGWDTTLGGNALNGIVLDHIVDQFTKSSAASSAGIQAADVKAHGRTAAKLWREAERVRGVLSANTDVRSTFESLYNDIDFATKISRTDFEEMTAKFADGVDKPIRQALEMAQLSVSDLNSVILHGGAIRTPFVQKRLEQFIGKSSEIRSNVNADESAAFGAAFKAAGLSPSFKVKEIRDYDVAVYPAGLTQVTDGKERKQKLFLPTSQTGVVKQLTFKNWDDFDIGFYQELNGQAVALDRITTANLTASVAALSDKFGCTNDDISTKFQIKLSSVDNLPEVLSASVSCEVEGSGKAGSIGDSVKDFLGFGKKDQEPLKDGEEAEEPLSADAAADNKTENATSSKKDTKPKKRTEVINIRLESTSNGPQPSSTDLDRMRERMAAFDRSDKGRVQREEALNVLEAFTYRARDLLSDATFEAASTDSIRSQISKLLGTTSDWLYGEGASATTDVLKGKLADLKALVDPILKRREETAGRPEKLSYLEGALNSTKSVIEMVKEQLAKAEASSSSLAAAAIESAASATSAETATTTNDFADLEEPDTTTTSSEAPTPSIFSPYEAKDLTTLTEIYDSVTTWLEEKLSAQKKLSAYDDPALTIKDLEAKGEQLQKAMMSLLSKKIQLPKSKKPKTSKSRTRRSKTTSTSTTAAEGETATEPVADTPDNEPFIFEETNMLDKDQLLNMIKKRQGSNFKVTTKDKHDEL